MNDIRTSFFSAFPFEPPSRSTKSYIFCMSLICLIYDGNVTDHDDTRGVRPGVTAVQLRLHPAVDPELSV